MSEVRFRRVRQRLRLESVDAAVTSSLTTAGNAEQVAPNVLSIAQWERIVDGELYAASARVVDLTVSPPVILREGAGPVEEFVDESPVSLRDMRKTMKQMKDDMR